MKDCIPRLSSSLTQRNIIFLALIGVTGDNRFRGEVSKITGMLLDLPSEEIIDLINDEEKLKGRIDEALKLLRDKSE